MALFRPDALHLRLSALDQLDAAFGDIDQEESAQPAIWDLANRLRRRLEALNSELYRSIRSEIAGGSLPTRFLQWLHRPVHPHAGKIPRQGMAFDAADELVSGVLELEEPEEIEILRSLEMVPYQPTPARHILDLIQLGRLGAGEVLVDLGSGLGHVPLVVSILTGIRSHGIEIQPVYAACAERCARSLRLCQVSFIAGDARTADLSFGTVYYLYSPFNGSILGDVLARLRKEGARRPIRLCSLGPVTRTLASEAWLKTSLRPDPGRIAVFESR
jgi:histone methylation protein DOT1